MVSNLYNVEPEYHHFLIPAGKDLSLSQSQKDASLDELKAESSAASITQEFTFMMFKIYARKVPQCL